MRRTTLFHQGAPRLGEPRGASVGSPKGKNVAVAARAAAYLAEQGRFTTLYGYGRLNIDGYVTCTSPIKEASYCYTQAFRTGEIEAVSHAPVNAPDQARREFYAIQMETDIVKGVATYTKVLRDAGLIAPIAVMLTIVGVRGCRVAFGGYDPPHRQDITIDRDLVLLPDVLLEPRDIDYARLLRPTFDVLWQASGFERSYGYDKDGNWDPKVHRT